MRKKTDATSVEPLVTYCSKCKSQDKDPIPAVRRYTSDRIQGVWQKAKSEDRPMFILSGLLGLIDAMTPIRLYEKLLRPEDVGSMVDLVAHQLLWYKFNSVEYVTKDIASALEARPYHDLMAAACKREQVKMAVTKGG